MITQLKLDESTKLEFGVSITGVDSNPSARFIIEGANYSLMLNCKHVNENIEVEVPILKSLLPAGEYPVRLEVVIDNKIYTPLSETIVFEPSIEISTKQKPKTIKESVKVGKVTVTKTQVSESMLRKSQAALIIANSLGYVPSKEENPSEIIEHAIESAGELTQEQSITVSEMLALAESVGINIDNIVMPEIKPIINEVKIEKKEDPDEDDLSDSDLDSFISGLQDDDYLEVYDDDELGVYHTETGELMEEDLSESTELNEILSRAERIKSRLRMVRNKTKIQTKLKMALHRHSTGAVLNHRARRLAIKSMEKKIAKKPLDQLSVGEKERVERIIARRKKAIDRLAMKLVPHIRQVEKDRLSRH